MDFDVVDIIVGGVDAGKKAGASLGRTPAPTPRACTISDCVPNLAGPTFGAGSPRMGGWLEDITH